MKLISFFRLKPLSFLFFILCCMALSSCGLETSGPKAVQVKYPNPVLAPWKEEFKSAEKEFEAKRYNPAEKIYRAYIKNYPYNELTDTAEFRLGQIAMLRQSYPAAIQIYKNLIKKTPSPAVKSKSNVKLGICYYRQNNFAEALAAFNASRDSYVDEREQVKMSTFAIRAASELNQDLNRKAYYYTLLYDLYQPLNDAEIKSRYGADSPSKSDVETQFKKFIESPVPIEAIDRRLQEYRGKYSGPLLDYKIGKAYYEAKDYRHAQESLKRFVSKNPNHPQAADANKILASLGAMAPANTKGTYAVGVILPLSGKYEQYGNNTLRGMECAASAKPDCHGVSNIRLVVKDSGGDPNRAAALVDELVSQDKVFAIVGPLPSSEVEGVAKAAAKNGVTMLTLAQKRGATDLGDHVFRFSLTPNTQVKALLGYATRKKQVHSIGVLYPNNNYGQEFLAEIERLAPEYGVKLTAKTALSGGKSEGDELRSFKTSSSEVKKNGLGFDAIFFPDSYANVGRLAPSLAKLGLADTLILGTNTWSDPSLPAKVNQTLKSTAFVDVYFRGAEGERMKAFIREFQSSYGYEPFTLEAMGYDAITVLSEALTSKKNLKKEDVAEALKQIHGFKNGVTNLRGFKNDREADVEPYLLTVEGSEIREIK